MKKQLIKMKIRKRYKRKDAEPYHLFEVKGKYFVFDTTGRRFYHIEKVMYEFLFSCIKIGIDRTFNEMASKNEYSQDVLEDVLKTVTIFKKNGLFDIPSYAVSEEIVSREISNDDRLPLTMLDLYLTDSCNLACQYCFCEVGRDHIHYGLMNEVTAAKAIDMLIDKSRDAKNIFVSFLGGEPLLNFKLLQYVVQYACSAAKEKGKNINFAMTSNGTLITDEIASYMGRNHISVMISLDGPREHHNFLCPMRDGGNSFDATLRGIECLFKYGITPEIRTTLGRPLPRLSELEELYRSLGKLNRIVIEVAKNCIDTPSPVDVTEEEFDDWLQQEEKELDKLVARLQHDNRDAPPYFPYQRYINNIVDSKPISCYYSCGAGTMRCTVDAQGNIYPCALFSGMREWQIGNVIKGVDKIRRDNVWKQYARAISPKCRFCWAYAICRPASPCDLAKADGTLIHKHRFCRQKKTRIERAAYLYYMGQKSDMHEASQKQKRREEK